MPRPKKLRFISGSTEVGSYIPENVEPTGVIDLSMEGLEAIRLTDYEKLDQETAAQRMGVSRQTYGRVLAQARQAVATALVTRQRLRIDGGAYCLGSPGHGRQRRRHRGWK
ncbi:DUF134 domain-containing protein [Desulfofustis glycolicus]|uniref:Predicted DNA-binding protein, UPF0251 family n=1 Tax=Desulfofustis glycolicus DSM 9705 TaxID=1121409 RepID=A0A1M5SAK0_9BACT|nr:DUF134 domain-containing protein [Desulfofustis glycolicus]MCB2216184.1 DUF134 domain-containing protein [Desulfobulbaceae bacterium]SHH35495.1 Predicted DNA-binding protein, UPF0251 family [Desulfofustis glycolicus DSM 9705]